MRRIPAVLLACAGLVLLAACSSGHPTATASSVLGGSTTAGPLAFAACMRSNGVAAYPDPDPTGQIAKESASQLGVTSSGLESAQRACQHLRPTPSAAQPRAVSAQALRFSTCVRRHGVTNFPDPGPDGRIPDPAGLGIDQGSPRFEAANQACAEDRPPYMPSNAAYNAYAADERVVRRLWVVTIGLVLVGTVVALAVADPFSSGASGRPGPVDADPTGLATVVRQDVVSQTQVPATLGYAGSISIAPPSGASASSVAQAQQAVAEDQQASSADEQAESDMATADDQAIAADRTNVAIAESTVPASPSTLAAAEQQLAADRSKARLDHDEYQAKVDTDLTKLLGDQATSTSLQATEVNPGTTYTALPQVGEVIREDQPVYSVSGVAVPLLYGSIAGYRVFLAGMSDGADVGELTRDLIALGDGAGLTQGDHYSAATAAAVERWQQAHGMVPTGTILLGEAVFEPGPIRVTEVTPSIGASVGGDGSGGSGGGGGTVLSATTTTRQVTIALDSSDQTEVKAGDNVTITLPDDQTTPGVISSVGTVATAPPSGQGGGGGGGGGNGSDTPTITVLVNPTDPAATRTWDQAPVNVTITTGNVSDVLVVPVDALLAEVGGRDAVEVVGAGGGRRMVAVTIGLFDDADGVVQVSGSGVRAGQRVVVPNL